MKAPFAGWGPRAQQGRRAAAGCQPSRWRGRCPGPAGALGTPVLSLAPAEAGGSVLGLLGASG